MEPETLTGSVPEPIAIIGLSFKLPQEATDESNFWKVLSERKNLSTEWPKDRFTMDSLFSEEEVCSHVLHLWSVTRYLHKISLLDPFLRSSFYDGGPGAVRRTFLLDLAERGCHDGTTAAYGFRNGLPCFRER